MTPFDKWKQSLPSRQRREVENWYNEELKGSAVEEARKEIETQLEEHMEHDRLVGKIAFLFTEGEEIANKSSWRFITFDPLCELGKSNADILIFNFNKKIALIIEVKTGNKEQISSIKKAKEVIDNNIDYLEKFIGSEVEEIKYMLVVNSFAKAIKLKKGCNDNGFALGYVEDNKLKIHSGFLTPFKEKYGIPGEIPLVMGDSIYVMLGSHDFHILSNTLVEIARKKLKEAKGSNEDIKTKEFTMEEFIETFKQLAYISRVTPGSRYERYINKRVGGIIEEGLRSGLIKKTDENVYRIYSHAAVSIGKIEKTIEKKYVDYYIETHKKKIAEENARIKYKDKYKRYQRRLDLPDDT